MKPSLPNTVYNRMFELRNVKMTLDRGNNAVDECVIKVLMPLLLVTVSSVMASLGS